MLPNLPIELIDLICYYTDDSKIINNFCSDYYYKKYRKRHLKNAVSEAQDTDILSNIMKKHNNVFLNIFNPILIEIPGSVSYQRFHGLAHKDYLYSFKFTSTCQNDDCDLIHAERFQFSCDEIEYIYDIKPTYFPVYAVLYQNYLEENHCLDGVVTSYDESVNLNTPESDLECIGFCQHYIRNQYYQKPYQLKQFSMQFIGNSIIAFNNGITKILE